MITILTILMAICAFMATIFYICKKQNICLKLLVSLIFITLFNSILVLSCFFVACFNVKTICIEDYDYDEGVITFKLNGERYVSSKYNIYETDYLEEDGLYIKYTKTSKYEKIMFWPDSSYINDNAIIIKEIYYKNYTKE